MITIELIVDYNYLFCGELFFFSKRFADGEPNFRQVNAAIFHPNKAKLFTGMNSESYPLRKTTKGYGLK